MTGVCRCLWQICHGTISGYSSAQVLQQHMHGCEWVHVTLVYRSDINPFMRATSEKGKDKQKQLVWPFVCLSIRGDGMKTVRKGRFSQRLNQIYLKQYKWNKKRAHSVWNTCTNSFLFLSLHAVQNYDKILQSNTQLSQNSALSVTNHPSVPALYLIWAQSAWSFN